MKKVNWFSTYHVHHRVTEHFRKGRAFLLGDAAHIHSPAGGQGMNTGIGDAINLAWKLAAAVAGRAGDNLLDSYEAERIGFARRLVATTDRVFSFATAEGRIADILRTRIAPLLIPRAAAFGAVREYLFRTVSQVMLNYRGGPLSRGTAGHVQGGDRLPWVRIDGADNFASLAGMDWQVHVYGAPSPDSRHGARVTTSRCTRSAGDPNMRRPGLPAMRSICCGPTAMWRWPTPPARRMPSPATLMMLVSGLRRARQDSPIFLLARLDRVGRRRPVGDLLAEQAADQFDRGARGAAALVEERVELDDIG